MNFTTLVKNPAMWLALALCLVTVLIYRPGLSGDYMFDDRTNLLENSRLEMGTFSLSNLASAAFSSGSGTLRRPVSMASFALNRYFFGISPYSNKVVNLCIHLLTGAGLWILGSLIVRSYRLRPDNHLPTAALRWLPLVVAGLWLVHPLNLTTVLYIVQRMAGLSAMFSVFGLCLYLLGRLRMLEDKAGMPLILTGLFLFGGLAVLSKENGILLPLYMLVLEITLFHFRSGQEKRDHRIVVFFLVTLAVPALVLLMILLFHPEKLISYATRTFTMSERLLTEARVMVFYLKMIIMPSISQLGLYHDDISISRGLLDPPGTLFSLLLLSGLLVTAAALLTRNALVSMGILWFFSGHLLESTILPLEIAHEHRNYLADYGILLASCALMMQSTLLQTRPLLRIAGPATFLLLFSYTTWLRAEQWSDNINHAIYQARHHPQSPRAIFAAGRIYARMSLEGVPGSADKAFDYLEKASQLDKGEILPDVTLLQLWYYLGAPVDEAIFERIKYKLKRYPISASTIVSLQTLTDCLGNKCEMPAQQLEEMFQLALAQTYTPQLNTLYGFYRINKLSDFQTGLKIFSRVTEERPREPQNWINLVNLLLVMGRYDEAETQLNRLTTVDLYGGNRSTYVMLSKEIEKARNQDSTTSDQTTTIQEVR